MNKSAFSTINNSKTSVTCDFKGASWFLDFQPFALFFVGGCGIFGNIFIIVLAVKYTVRRNLHHLIINMAVVDTLVVLSMWTETELVSDEIPCRVFTFLTSTSIGVSYMSLVAISIERFRASKQAIQILQPYRRKQRLAAIACSWLISFALALFENPYVNIEKNSSGEMVCRGTESVPDYMTAFRNCVFLSAIGCVIILSIATLRRISHRQAIEASISEDQRKARAKRTISTIKMVLISLLIFCCSYLPYGIWKVLKIILEKENIFSFETIRCFERIFSKITNLLPIVNSCLSPVIYLIFLADFWKAVKRLVCRNVHPLEMEPNARQQHVQ